MDQDNPSPKTVIRDRLRRLLPTLSFEALKMTFVVIENCIKCNTRTAGVCPVDCFHEGSNFLVIDPEDGSTARFAS